MKKLSQLRAVIIKMRTGRHPLGVARIQRSEGKNRKYVKRFPKISLNRLSKHEDLILKAKASRKKLMNNVGRTTLGLALGTGASITYRTKRKRRK